MVFGRRRRVNHVKRGRCFVRPCLNTGNQDRCDPPRQSVCACLSSCLSLISAHAHSKTIFCCSCQKKRQHPQEPGPRRSQRRQHRAAQRALQPEPEPRQAQEPQQGQGPTPPQLEPVSGDGSFGVPSRTSFVTREVNAILYIFRVLAIPPGRDKVGTLGTVGFPSAQ